MVCVASMVESPSFVCWLNRCAGNSIAPRARPDGAGRPDVRSGQAAIRPRSLRLTNLLPPMTTWSRSSMSSSSAACFSFRVMSTSSGLGSGFRLGWLWLMMTAGDGFEDGVPEHLRRADDRAVHIPLVDDCAGPARCSCVSINSTRSCSWASLDISGPSRS